MQHTVQGSPWTVSHHFLLWTNHVDFYLINCIPRWECLYFTNWLIVSKSMIDTGNMAIYSHKANCVVWFHISVSRNCNSHAFQKHVCQMIKKIMCIVTKDGHMYFVLYDWPIILKELYNLNYFFLKYVQQFTRVHTVLYNFYWLSKIFILQIDIYNRTLLTLIRKPITVCIISSRLC